MDKNLELSQKILEEVVCKYFVFRLKETSYEENGAIVTTYTEKAWDIFNDIQKMVEESYPQK